MQRIMARAEGLDPAACWDWPGKRNGDGYGRIKLAGGDREEYVHRIVLEGKLGRPLWPHEQTRHDCDNPPCFNPAHLRPGTAHDNVTDMMTRGRYPHDARHRQPRGKGGRFASPSSHNGPALNLAAESDARAGD